MPRINVGLTCCICLNQGRLPNEWVTLIMCGELVLQQHERLRLE